MVKVRITGDLKGSKLSFEKQVKEKVQQYILDVIIPQIENDIKRLFDKTIVGWSAAGQVGSQGRRKNYPTPHADFIEPEIEIKAGNQGLNIEFKIGFSAKEPGGAISYLWYILDFGRPDGTWDSATPSAWFLPQSSTRTQANSLNVQTNRTFIASNQNDGWIGNSGRAKVEDGLVYIRKLPGDAWAGITPRNWSKLIAEEIRRIYQKHGLKVTYTRKKP